MQGTCRDTGEKIDEGILEIYLNQQLVSIASTQVEKLVIMARVILV
jgi:hypothetical protein